MFEALTRLFGKTDTPADLHDPKLAVAALLVHLAAVDGTMDDKERQAIRGALMDHYDLDEASVDKLIRELEGQLAEKRVTIRLTPAAKSWLAREGYDPDFGARPLRRLIMKEIGDVLTEEILFGNLARGGEARVDLQEGKLSFTYER